MTVTTGWKQNQHHGDEQQVLMDHIKINCAQDNNKKVITTLKKYFE